MRIILELTKRVLEIADIAFNRYELLEQIKHQCDKRLDDLIRPLRNNRDAMIICVYFSGRETAERNRKQKGIDDILT